MIKKEFTELMGRIGAIFSPLTTDAMERYYEHLNQSPIGLLKKAFFLIEERHAFGRFPLISEIREAMSRIESQAAYKTAADFELDERLKKCNICHEMGWEIVDGPRTPWTLNTRVARNCSCLTGQRRAKAQELARARDGKKPLPGLRYVEKYFDGVNSISPAHSDAAEYPPEWDREIAVPSEEFIPQQSEDPEIGKFKTE